MIPRPPGWTCSSRCAPGPALADRTAFLTGGTFTDRAREFLARCDRPRIEKPFEPGQLRDLVEALVAPRQHAGAFDDTTGT